MRWDCYCINSDLNTFRAIYKLHALKLGSFALLLELLGNEDALRAFLRPDDMMIA